MRYPRAIPILTGAIAGIILCMFAMAICSYRAHAQDIRTFAAPSVQYAVDATGNDESAVYLQKCTAAADQCHQPLLILVGATWCGYCKEVETTCVPVLKTRGVYVHLDADQHKRYIQRLGCQITRLPTLVEVKAGKVVRVLVGPKAIKDFAYRGS